MSKKKETVIRRRMSDDKIDVLRYSTYKRTLSEKIKHFLMRFNISFKWYDMWIGIFVDTKKKYIYINPFFCIVIRVCYAKKHLWSWSINHSLKSDEVAFGIYGNGNWKFNKDGTKTIDDFNLQGISITKKETIEKFKKEFEETYKIKP